MNREELSGTLDIYQLIVQPCMTSVEKNLGHYCSFEAAEAAGVNGSLPVSWLLRCALGIRILCFRMLFILTAQQADSES